MKFILLYGIIGILWTFYRLAFHFPEAVDEFIFKPIIFVGPILAWVKIKEKRDLNKSLIIGGLLGLVFAADSGERVGKLLIETGFCRIAVEKRFDELYNKGVINAIAYKP